MELEGLKQKEFRFATGVEVCSDCGKKLASGQPYLLLRQIKTENNRFAIDEQMRCLRLCSEFRPQEPVRRKSLLPEIRPEWDSCPDVATVGQRTTFPIVTLGGERIATGYNAIISGPDDDVVFLECEEEQVVTTMFTENKGESNGYVWKRMDTPKGFFGRKYLRTNGNLMAGFWYFRLNLVKPAGEGSLV